MIGTRVFDREVSFTRPNDTTQYADGDGVADATTTATVATFVIPGVAASSGCGGKIKKVTLYKSDQDQTGASFTVYFFTVQPVGTGFDDNAALAITDTEWKKCIGSVVLTAAADAENVVTGDFYCQTNLDLPYECANGSTSLYFVVVARGTYTPAAQEVFTFHFGGEVN